MSLNHAETRRTSAELHENLALTRLSTAQVAADLGWPEHRLNDALGLDGDPADVWELRDYLESSLAEMGVTGTPFSILTEANRSRARLWFRLRPAPSHANPSKETTR